MSTPAFSSPSFLQGHSTSQLQPARNPSPAIDTHVVPSEKAGPSSRQASLALLKWDNPALITTPAVTVGLVRCSTWFVQSAHAAADAADVSLNMLRSIRLGRGDLRSGVVTVDRRERYGDGAETFVGKYLGQCCEYIRGSDFCNLSSLLFDVQCQVKMVIKMVT